VYWLASLLGMTTAVSLAQLLLVQVRKLLEEAARVVRTWHSVRQDVALHRGSAEGRVGRPEPQADAQGWGTESDRTPLVPTWSRTPLRRTEGTASTKPKRHSTTR